MARSSLYLFLFLAMMSGARVPVYAQTDESVSSRHVKEIPPSLDLEQTPGGKEIPVGGLHPRAFPFSIDSTTGEVHSIKVLSESEMSRGDQDLLADAQSSIQERAGFENLEFEREGWTYHELVCPALPNHMFLRFTRDDGTRQMSMFSAAIPRNGNGRVHIIPIVRQGYSLFSPAPIGALTIAAFNRVRTEEGEGAGADWLGTGLCYAALAGANPEIGGVTVGSDEEVPAVLPPTLTITGQGGAVIQFVDVSTMPKPMEWTMTFDVKGKLTKAEHRPTTAIRMGKTKVDAQEAGGTKP